DCDEDEDNVPKQLSLEECQKLINELSEQCDSEPDQPENVPNKSESCIESSKASSKRDCDEDEDNLSKPQSLEECQNLINEPSEQCDSEPDQPENVPEMNCTSELHGSTESGGINELVTTPDSEKDNSAPNLDCADNHDLDNDKPHDSSPGKSNLTILPVNSQTPRQMSPIGHPHLENQQDKITISINCSLSEKINSVHLHYEGPRSAHREERNEEDTSVETDVLSVEYTEKSKELRWGVEHRLRQESEELVNMTDEDESISNIDK
ncbi:unnamed protein product, partial [Rodentolepis nana]|uniref:CG2 omega n=1 Tax=Rodentolepis nana TaxID=102285 RepID=A0A0R3TDI9_RODNA